jgi:hypothetical protein
MNRLCEARSGLGQRAALLAAVATVGAGGVLSGGAARAQASAAERKAAMPVELAQRVAQVQRRLKECHERIAELGKALFDETEAQMNAVESVTNQTTTVNNADAEFKNAALAREIAEIAVATYVEGIAKNDKATIQGEIKLAERELTDAKERVEVMKQRLAKIKAAGKGSATDVALEYQYEDHVADAEGRVRKAMVALERAQHKLKAFVDYTKEKTTKELRSEVEKARSLELAKKAEWILAEGKLRQLERSKEAGDRDGSTDALFSSLDAVLALDERVRTELGQLEKSGAVDQRRATSIRELMTQLEGAVGLLEAKHAAARVDRLKAVIHGAGAKLGQVKRNN